jgi:hypothetical protein
MTSPPPHEPQTHHHRTYTTTQLTNTPHTHAKNYEEKKIESVHMPRAPHRNDMTGVGETKTPPLNTHTHTHTHTQTHMYINTHTHTRTHTHTHAHSTSREGSHWTCLQNYGRCVQALFCRVTFFFDRIIHETTGPTPLGRRGRDWRRGEEAVLHTPGIDACRPVVPRGIVCGSSDTCPRWYISHSL